MSGLGSARRFQEDNSDAQSEMAVRRIGGGEDDSSVGDESFIEVNQMDGSSASGSINVISGAMSESSYGIRKIN